MGVPMLSSELEKLNPTQKHTRAIAMVVEFCRKKRRLRGEMRNHSLKQLRAHFESLDMLDAQKKLGVSFRDLIDECIRNRAIEVTGEFVWVRESC
jgi:hypothetical protein